MHVIIVNIILINIFEGGLAKMLLFLAIVGELGTIIGSHILRENGIIDSLLEISNNGYKIDKNFLNEYQKNYKQDHDEDITISDKVLRAILLLTPGINLIYSTIINLVLKKGIMNDPLIKENIVPMTDYEKKQYSRMESRREKFEFVIFMASNKEEDFEFLGVFDNKIVFSDQSVVYLDNKKLPLAYTLDEVKQLNEATGNLYMIGMLDEKAVAIIGIPDSNIYIKRIRFKLEDYKLVHDYINITEEEAKDKIFVVYPFINEFEDDERLQKRYDEVKRARFDDATKEKLEALIHKKPLSKQTMEKEISPSSCFDNSLGVLSNEKDGMRLIKKKTLNNRNSK